ncbi:MAG: Mrp/NBP35 family ATP-binding protein [Phycisphaerales bacterium]
MPLDKAAITEAFRTVPYPGGGDVVSAGAVLHLAACDGHVSARVRAVGQTAPALDQLGAALHTAAARQGAKMGERLRVLAIEFVGPDGAAVHQATFDEGPGQPRTPPTAPPAAPPTAAASPAGPAGPGGQAAGHRPIPGLQPSPSGMPGIRSIIAVGAGKGGVGKSSIAVNLAVGLARKGHAVGLLDGDIYGPSIPTMLGLQALEQVVHAGKLQPFAVHGVKAITIGKLVDEGKPLIWRGPMAHGAFKQLAEQTAWGELDYLIIDLPPGTGDVSLTMAQVLKLTGAVIVCTPQRVAQDDAVRATKMFQQLGIEVLGVVENMSYFVGDDGKTYDLFGRGGAEQMAGRLNLPFLGAIPITTALRVNSDTGDPTANFDAPTDLSRALEALVQRCEEQASLASLRQGTARPTLKVS